MHKLREKSRREDQRRGREIKKFKYIGETARSAYERGLEHLRDYEERKLDSHILNHLLGRAQG